MDGGPEIVSALEAYCKLYVSQVAPWKVAEFLITHREFPRSIRYCVDSLDAALHSISGVDESRYGNEAERLSGRLRSDVDYVTIGEIFEFGLHEYLSRDPGAPGRSEQRDVCDLLRQPECGVSRTEAAFAPIAHAQARAKMIQILRES